MIIKEYESSDFNIWNEFILNSRQGTFLLNKDFMNYHSDRFEDNSLMFYNKKDKLIAVLPANIKDNVLYSHQGLSYGGLIYGKETKTVDILECFEALKFYAKENKINKLLYKRIPAIYQNYPADEDLYALFRHDAKLIRRDIGYVINMDNPIKWLQARRTELNKSFNNKLRICEINNHYGDYHTLLSQVLKFHNVKPVHSLQEMELLANKFPDNIRLICSFKDQEMMSGVWLFIEKNTLHVQYIATSEEGRKTGGFEAIIDFILQNYSNKKYLSFGISTEDNGRVLNEGLAFQKESFGGRGIVYDFYEIEF